MIHGKPLFKSSDGRDDGVAIEFEGTSEGEELSGFVTREIDAGHGFDEVAASADEAAGVGSPKIFCAEAKQFGAGFEVSVHDAGGVIHVGGVDEQGDCMLSGDAADLDQRERTGAAIEMSGEHDHRGALGAGLLKVGGSCGERGANLDETTSGDANHAVVFVAVGFLDEDFVFETSGIGELLPRVSVFAGDAGSGAKGDGSGGAWNDTSGFCTDELGKDFA